MTQFYFGVSKIMFKGPLPLKCTSSRWFLMIFFDNFQMIINNFWPTSKGWGGGERKITNSWISQCTLLKILQFLVIFNHSQNFKTPFDYFSCFYKKKKKQIHRCIKNHPKINSCQYLVPWFLLKLPLTCFYPSYRKKCLLYLNNKYE